MITIVSAHQSFLHSKKRMQTLLTKSWRQLLPLFAISIVLSACNSDTLNLVANAGDPNVKDLADNKFLTDAVFAPKITSIELYDICRSIKGTTGFRCDPADGSLTNQSNNTLPDPGQKAVNSPVRLLVTMDKPVFLDQGTQESVTLGNAQFSEPVGSLQPVVAPEGEFTSFLEPSNDPATLRGFKFSLFTTEHTSGHIHPEADGTVTVTFPAGLVYAVNVNGKKIYNTAASSTFIYDTSRPLPKLKLVDSQGIIERSGEMSALTSGFSQVVLEIDWGEEVSTIGQPFNTSAKDSSILGVSCISFSGCVDGGNNDPEYIYFGALGSGRTFDAGKSTDKKYYVNLLEADTTGDGQAYLTKFINDIQINVDLAEGIVKDKAGNLNQEATTVSLKVDAVAPKLSKVEISLENARAPEVVGGNKRTILKIGDRIKYKLSTTEAVFVKDTDDIVIDFDIGTKRSVAKVDDTLVGQQRGDWDLIYTIQEGDGGNKIAFTQSSAYIGQSNSADLTTNWLSDIGAIYNIVSNDKVFDAVDNPIAKDNFRDRYFLQDSAPSSGDFSDHIFGFMHVDGIRPKIDTDVLLRYSRRLSADTSTDASVIANDNKLAVAIPFSEAIYLSRNKPLNLDKPTVWGATQLKVGLFSDTFGTQFIRTITLNYDHALTQIAQSDNYFNSHPNILAYSIRVNDTFTPSSSIRLGKLSATPFGVAPTTLRDYAENSFDLNQSQSDGFVFDDFLVDIAIDGGPFSIASVYPMYKDQANAVVAVDPAVVEQKYNDADVLYVGVQLTRPVTASLLTTPQLNLKIKKADGTHLDVSSDSLTFGAGSSGDIKNILVFGFSLNNGLYEDMDGVEVVSLLDPSSVLRDDNGTLLDRTIRSSSIRGGTKILQQVRIDNKHPVCSSAFLTSSSSGVVPSSSFTLGVSNVLYMVLECDQSVTYSQGPNGLDDQAIIWTEFGDTSTDAFNVVFRYESLSNAGKSLVYALPIEFGYRPGDNGRILAGELGNLTLKKYYNATSKVEGEFDFFADAFGNSVVLGFSANYFVEKPVYGINSTIAERLNSGAVTVDVTPAPVKVRYILPKGAYIDASGDAYIPGGNQGRLDKKNVLTIEVDYGYFDASGDIQLRPLVLDSNEDASIDIYFAGGSAVAGKADFVKLGAQASTMIYEMQTDYQSTAPNGLAVLAIQAGDKLRPIADAFLPYTSNDVITYKVSGAPVTTPSAVDTPIRTEFLATTEGLGSLPPLKINNKRPTLVNASTEGKYPVEVWWLDNSRTMQQLNPRGKGSNPDTLYFGDIYFALVFDKDITEDSFSDTVIAVNTSTDSGQVRISTQKMSWINSSLLVRLGGSNAALAKNKVFYKFTYDNTRYEGNGFNFASPLISVTSGEPQDIYGNEVDIAEISAVATAIGYDVTTDSRTDITSLVFDKEQYIFDDVINITVETRARLNTAVSLNSSQVLALQAKVTVNEEATNPVEKTIIIPHVTISSISAAEASPTGKAVITFKYDLNKLTEQFDDDNTGDLNLGIVPFGSVLRCPSDAIDSINCSSFSVQLLNASGVPSRQAGLGVDEIIGIGELAGVNTLLPKFVINSGDTLADIVRVQYKANLMATALPLTSSPILRAGNTLVFSVPVSLQNSGSNSLTYDSSVADKPIFNFSLFNLLSSANASRQATLVTVDGSNLIFEYTIQAGDYAGIPTDDKAIKLSSGLDSTNDRPAVFSTSSLISSALSSQTFTAIKDSIYSNPLYRRVLDSSGDAIAIQYELTGDLSIDTRPYMTEIVSLLETSTKHSSGTLVKFYVSLSEEVEVSSEAGFTISIVDGGTSTDLTAVYSEKDRSDDARKPIFQFTSPAGVSGTAKIMALNVDGDNTFIRGEASKVNANPDINSITTNSVNLLQFDAAEPKIIQFNLSSASGSAPYSYASGSTLSISATLDKTVDITVDSSSARPSLEVSLARKASSQPLRVTMYYNGGTVLATKTMVFDLSIDATSTPGVQDYDGLTVVEAKISLPRGAEVTGSDAPNSMATVFSNTAKNDIETLNVHIDASEPRIERIIELKGGAVGAAADYSADKEIVFQVSFDETVDFLNATDPSSFSANHYSLDLSFDGNKKLATLDLDPTSDTSDKQLYYFKLDTATGLEALAGTVSLNSFLVNATAGAVIRDKSGNPLKIYLPEVNQDFSKLQVDAIKPTVTATSITAGLYADQSILEASITLSEKVTVVGLPQLEVALTNSDSTSPSTNVLFTYDATKDVDNEDNQVTFSYKVKSSDFSSGMTNTAQVNDLSMDTINYISDSFINRAESIPLQPSVSGVTVDPNLGASIVNVAAWVKEVDSGARVINPDTTAQTYTSKHLLYMVAEFSRDLSLDIAATTVKMDFSVDTSSATTLHFDLTNDLGATNAKTLTFVLDPMPTGLKIPLGIKAQAALIVTGSPNTIGVKGVDSAASLILSNRFANDKDNNSFLETVLINTAPPAVSDVTSDTVGYYNAGKNIVIDLSFDVDVQVSGDPTLLLNIGGLDKTADYRSNNNNLVRFQYEVQAGDNDLNGIKVKSLVINGADSISDSDSNTIPIGVIDLTPFNLPAPIFIDTTTPYVLRFVRAIDNVGDVTGDVDVSNDGVTDDTQLDLVWNLKDPTSDATTDLALGSKVQLYGGPSGVSVLGTTHFLTQAEIDSGLLTITTPTQASGTTSVFNIQMTDAAGNDSVATTNAFKVTFDTFAPLTPGVSIRDQAGAKTDDNVIDGETVDSTELVMRVTFDNTDSNFAVVVGDIIKIYDGTNDLQTNTVTQGQVDDGFGEFAINSLTFGTTYSFTVDIADTAGNLSPRTTAIRVTVKEPPAPADTDPSAFYDDDRDNDYSNGDTITLKFNQNIEFSAIDTNKEKNKTILGWGAGQLNRDKSHKFQ